MQGHDGVPGRSAGRGEVPDAEGPGQTDVAAPKEESTAYLPPAVLRR